MADKDDLMEPAKVHGPAQHANVLLAIDSIQCSHRFVPEERFITNAFALPHVVACDAQVDSFVVVVVTVKCVNVRPDGVCDKPFQTLSGVGEVAVFIEVEITGVSEAYGHGRTPFVSKR
jgi:hypothetical protein